MLAANKVINVVGQNIWSVEVGAESTKCFSPYTVKKQSSMTFRIKIQGWINTFGTPVYHIAVREAICYRVSDFICGKTRCKSGSNKCWMKCSLCRENSLFLSNLLQREPSCSLVKFCSTDSPTEPAPSSRQDQNTHTDRPRPTELWLPKHEVKKENIPLPSAQ